MEGEIELTEFGKIAQIIIINEVNHAEIDDIKAVLTDNDITQERKEYSLKIREYFPEIYAFFRLYKEEALKQVEKEDINLFLIYEKENPLVKEFLQKFLEKRGFYCQEISIKAKEPITSTHKLIFNPLREFLLKVCPNYDEMLFNITSGSLNIKRELIRFAEEIEGRVYILTNNDDLIFIPDLITHKIHEPFNYEEIMYDSLNFTELNENGLVHYDIKLEIIPNTLQCQKEIQENSIVISKKRHHQLRYDVIKFMKINGIKISSDETIASENYFLTKVFEGLSYFKNTIFKLILNNGNGIVIYLGLMVSDSSLNEIYKKLNLNLAHFEKLLRAIFPGLEISAVKNKDLEDIIKFIRAKNYFGSMVGFPTIPTSNYLLKELENALSQEAWGMITIAENLNEITINKIQSELKAEINSLLENIPSDLEEIREKQKSKDWKEWRKNINVSRLKINYIIKLDKIFNYIEEKRISGIWNTSNYLFSENESTYNAIYSILKSNYKSINHFWFPTKIIPLDEVLIQFVKNFQQINVSRQIPSISKEFKLYRTIISSSLLGSYIFFPSRSLSNFEISKVPTFQSIFPKNVLEKFRDPIKIGAIKNSIQRDNHFYMDLPSFTRHCLVMGSTGSGKTNTIMNILLKIKEKNENFPFLIIDPVKKEYRQLRNFFQDLEIYTTGRRVNPLKINLFEVPPFLSYSQWINELIELISNAFYLWSPFRDILWNCMNDIYQVYGWDEDTRGIIPTLDQFLQFSKLKIDCLDYDAKVRDSFKGSLESRFESLVKGTRALTFNVYRSRPSLDEILQKPIVLELAGLMNDNEKALIFNLILKKLYLYQQNLGFARDLRHITIIEEAHRLISAGGETMNSQDQSIKMKSREVFSDILSEIRTYGEGILISEQKPKELTKAAITNTNLKICHKLPSTEQVMSFKDSLGLMNEHIPFITRLKPGECITKIEEVDTAFFLQVDFAKDEEWGIEKDISDEVLIDENPPLKKLEQLHYTLSTDEDRSKDDIEFSVNELIYHQDGKEIKIPTPTDQECFEFENFYSLLWERLKEFYSKYVYCPNCLKVYPISSAMPGNKCSNCQKLLIKIGKIKVPILNTTITSSVMLRLIKLDSLCQRHKELAPSEFDRNSQTKLKDLKKEFVNIMDENYQAESDSRQKNGLAGLF